MFGSPFFWCCVPNLVSMTLTIFILHCRLFIGLTRDGLFFPQVSMRTEVKFVRDMLRGDDVFEIRLKLLEQMPEEYPYKNDE